MLWEALFHSLFNPNSAGAGSGENCPHNSYPVLLRFTELPTDRQARGLIMQFDNKPPDLILLFEIEMRFPASGIYIIWDMDPFGLAKYQTVRQISNRNQCYTFCMENLLVVITLIKNIVNLLLENSYNAPYLCQLCTVPFRSYIGLKTSPREVPNMEGRRLGQFFCIIRRRT